MIARPYKKLVLLGRFGCVHQLAGVELDVALRESAGDEEIVGEIREIIYAGFHRFVLTLRDRGGDILREAVPLECGETGFQR